MDYPVVDDLRDEPFPHLAGPDVGRIAAICLSAREATWSYSRENHATWRSVADGAQRARG